MASRLLQLLSGRDFATGNPLAREMRNFSYIIADDETKQAVLVDPAYDVKTIVSQVEQNGFKLVGVLATHYHPDHVGGNLMGSAIEGILQLKKTYDVPIHVNKHELPWVSKVTGIAPSELVAHDSGDEVELGYTRVVLIHTPGHTPGSHCFLVENRLISGDTLFLDGCGRLDLPGADPEAMYYSLTQTLAKLPDDTILYPGHFYSPASFATMESVKSSNYVFRINSLDDWIRLMG